MKYLSLSQNKQAIVDDDDFGWLNQWKWTYGEGKDGHQFVFRKEPSNRTGKNIYLGRFILNAPKGLEVDHINQNPLDNRRSNLRLATRSQNAANMQLRKSNTTGYKGVSWQSDRKKWYATISINGKQHNLGRFKTAIEAAKAYNLAATEAFENFAVLNKGL